MPVLAHQQPPHLFAKIPRDAFTVSHTCDGNQGFMRAWSKTNWNMTCFDNVAMCRMLNKYNLPIPPMAIHRADIVRFLLLYERGGLYVDSDVYPIVRTHFQPESYLDATGLVVGYEAIVSRQEQIQHGIYRPKSLCMWTMFAIPRSPILLRLANHLSHNVQYDQRGHRTLNEWIHKTTGPTAITDFLLQKLHTIAPVLSFGCGQPHSGASFCDRRISFCKHHFAGSWRRENR